MEGAEQLVDPREVDREVHIEGLAFQPVVPVMEARRGDPVAQPVEVPADIGVQQRRPDIDEADIGLHHRGAKAQREQRQRCHRAQQHDLDHMHPRSRQPVHRLGAVVHRVEAPQERHLMEQPVVPILQHVRGDQHDGELHQPRQVRDHRPERLPIARIGVDDLRRRQRQERQNLHEHRADEEVEQILAPFIAEQALVAPVRYEAFERGVHEAGRQQIDDEEIEPEEDPPTAGIIRFNRRAAQQGRAKANPERRHAQHLPRTQQQAQQGKCIARQQDHMDGSAKSAPVAHDLQFGRGEPGRKFECDHHDQPADREQQAEEPGEPARAKPPHFHRRFQIAHQCLKIACHTAPHGLPFCVSMKRLTTQ